MTFSISFSPKKASFTERVKGFLQPPLFHILEPALDVLLAPHLREPARDLIQKTKMPALSKSDIVSLYYPGCGQDLVWPLLILHKIAPHARMWRITGQDTAFTMGALIATTQTLTGNSVYSRIPNQSRILNKARILENDQGIHSARFRFKGRIIEIHFSPSDALEGIPRHLEQGYDFYFERGFEICRSQSPGFIEEALDTLKQGGLAITDHAFARVPLGMKPLKHSLPAWGFYKNPAIYTKR